MFKKEYKNDFNSIVPDENLVEGTIQMFNRSYKKRSKTRIFAATMAICLLIVGGFIISNLNGTTFSLVAFADEDDSQYMSLLEDVQMVMPFGKISRGDRHSYIDETGNKIYTYDVGYDSGGISIKGKNIVEVKYTATLGELMFFDSVSARENHPPLQSEGEMVIYKPETSLIQRGKEITKSFNEERGDKSFNVQWSPWYAINRVSEEGTSDFSDLPKDNIEITVFFANGKSVKKNLQLSFDKDGNLVAEMSSEQ